MPYFELLIISAVIYVLVLLYVIQMLCFITIT